MAEKHQAAPAKVAPPRNELKAAPLQRTSLEFRNLDPDYVYERFDTRPNHPSYFGKKVRPHSIGDDWSEYIDCTPWEVVHAETDPLVEALTTRDDQGKGVDSVVRGAQWVMCRKPKTEYERTYGALEKARAAKIRGSHEAGAVEGYGSTGSTATAVSYDPEVSGSALMDRMTNQVKTR